jgi:hypothetical protein
MIGSTSNETPFLAESDVPECARLSGQSGDGESASELEDQKIAEAMGRTQAEMKKEEHQTKILCLKINFLKLMFKT